MFIEKSIKAFEEELKSGAPVPGGGAVAALDAASGAALIMMVANHTIGKPRYAEFEDECVKAVKRADELLEVLMAGIDDDAVAFGGVSAAYSMPKSTEEEKSARSEAIGAASVEAAEAPLRVMRAAVECLELDLDLVGRSNPNLLSDLYVAALNLQAGLVSAAFNVDANIPSIEKRDKELAMGMAVEKEALLERGRDFASKVLAGTDKTNN